VANRAPRTAFGDVRILLHNSLPTGGTADRPMLASNQIVNAWRDADPKEFNRLIVKI
jgi:hypothetical protein